MAGEGSSAYSQELARELGLLGNIGFTLSCATPAASVFVIVPLIVTTAGTGSILSMLLGATACVFMAFCWAELGAQFPIAGGDYSIVWHAFKGVSPAVAGVASFLTFTMLLASVFIVPATLALGAADYLKVLWQVEPGIAGAVLSLLATVVAVMSVRRAAFVTSIFLALELAALALIAALGFAHWQRNPIDLLLHPVVGTAAGGSQPVALATILSMTAVAVFAYNGFGAAVFYSEETTGNSRNIAHAVLISLVVTVVAEIIPVVAVFVGAPSIEALTTAASPFNYFMLATGGPRINALVSLAIVFAVFNAVTAAIVPAARILYAAGRDRAFPGPVSRWMAEVHRGLRVPLLATLLVGLACIVLCLTTPLDVLITLSGASLVLNYLLVALAGFAGRATGATATSPYKMPLWPLPPLLASGALIYVMCEQTLTLWIATGASALIALAYFFIYLWPRRALAWRIGLPVARDP